MPPLAWGAGALRRRPWTMLACAGLLALAVVFLRRRESEWEDVYVRAARHLWQGQSLYHPGTSYLYPPFMAALALPWVALPPTAGRLGWLAVNGLCLVALVRWAWRVAGGGALEGAGAGGRGEQAAAALGLACALPHLQNCLAHQQTDVVIAAVVLGGCLLLVRSRAFAAATCFGLAAACKCTPLLWAPYLLWRRWPGAALWLVAVALGANLVPDLLRPAPSGQLWLREYAATFLRPLARPDHYVGTWGSELIYNQSLAGAGQRWLTTRPAPAGGAPEALPNAAAPAVVRVAVLGAGALLVLGTLWAAGSPLRRADQVPGDGPRRQALEFSLVLALMLLLSPMSSKAHFGVLLLPGFCLARAAVRSRSAALWACLGGAAALAVVGNKDLLGGRLYTLSLWLGAVTWEALLLTVGCWIALRRLRAEAADEARPAGQAPLGAAA